MISLPQETLRLNYKMPTRKIRGIIRVWLRSNSSSQNEDDLRRRWDLTAAGICWWRRAEDSCGPHLCDCSSGEEGRTDRHRLATFPLSLSLPYIHTLHAHTRIVSPPAHISLAAGWKKQEQQSQQTVSWSVPLFSFLWRLHFPPCCPPCRHDGAVRVRSRWVIRWPGVNL